MIYLDHAATTPLDPRVLESMLPYLKDNYYNPSSAYRRSIRLKSDISEARRTIAESIGAKETEIVFTSGGTESDNYAIKGAAYALREKGNHIISSAIEHPAVLNTLKHLEKQGFFVSYVMPGENGRINSDDVRHLIRPKTILVSVMTANNETGVIQPVEEIGKICKENKILFHTDAVQAYGHIPVNVNDMRADLLSVSGHKIYGPKGIGFLYVRSGVRLENLLDGGEQERGLRPGTENVAGIMGLSKACLLMQEELPMRMEKEKEFSDIFIKRITSEISGVKLNTDPEHKLPGTVNFSFDNIEGETLLIQLDMKGVLASTGSACTQGNGEPSHVLKAMGLSEAASRGSLRLTAGYKNTKEEIEEACDIIKESIEYLRSMRI